MKKTEKLIIVGDSAFAEVAYQCFMHDSHFDVVGFAVEEAYRRRDNFLGLPVYTVENLTSDIDSKTVRFYTAIVYTNLNRLRSRLYRDVKAQGFKPASYLSSRAFIWPNVIIGDHCFILEGNTLQPYVRIGENVVLWSGNHIGHHSEIEDNCFISSHVVVSGSCSVGANTFIGVNASLANNLSVGEDNWIGPGVTLLQNTQPNQLFKGEQPLPSKVDPRRFFKVRT